MGVYLLQLDESSVIGLQVARPPSLVVRETQYYDLFLKLTIVILVCWVHCVDLILTDV
jgi:hypothetical protein